MAGISTDQIRVRLADINFLEMRRPKACEAGKKGAEYTKR
jgi:hypothetical protein